MEFEARAPAFRLFAVSHPGHWTGQAVRGVVAGRLREGCAAHQGRPQYPLWFRIYWSDCLFLRIARDRIVAHAFHFRVAGFGEARGYYPLTGLKDRSCCSRLREVVGLRVQSWW